MNSSVEQAVQTWLNEPAIEDAEKLEVRELLARGDEKELADRFYRELEFGTGGMRGIMGAGLNRMNIYTVGAAAQGLANYIRAQKPASGGGVAIAYDCRRMSPEFAERVACVMAGNGIPAFLFSALRPTPELSFAVRHLRCVAGVMITASHNPPEYNGLKIYWSDGGQVVPPHDEAVINEVRNVGSFSNIRLMDAAEARGKNLIHMIDRDVDEAFLNESTSACLTPEISRKLGKTLKIVFTALHGTGTTLIPDALKRRGFEHVIEVPEQAAPDGSFSTVKSPNPEESAAFDLGLKLAQRTGADLVIATDPDADRMGIAVRAADGAFETLTGNQISALLTYFICDQLKARGAFPRNAAVLSTIVSGGMMKDIARAYGATVIDVLTGFKWIAEKVRQFEADASHTYLFGSEESYGYMPATFTRDKDAVTSAAYIADLAAWTASQGRSLHSLLLDLYREYGYYQEGVGKNLTLPGKEGAEKIQRMIAALRRDAPIALGGLKVTAVGDYQSGELRDRESGRLLEKFDLPAAEVLCFALEDGTKALVRPSGTEPKIKFYMLTRQPGEDLAKAKVAANAKINAIVTDLEARADAS